MEDSKNSPSENFEINILGYPEELESTLKKTISRILKTIGQKINIANLDALTFAEDYRQALLQLDRGYETDYKLTPSNDHGVGIAMSPSVIRKNELKTHIIINGQMFLEMLETGQVDAAINTVAHECAHVELNHLFDSAFPNTLLRTRKNVLDHFRTECMLACWNEFGACWRSATFGPTNPLFYESAFLPGLDDSRRAANQAIMRYRTNGDISKVVNEVCGIYSSLLKYSAYHLGNLHGHGINWRTVPTTAGPLKDHWFLPFFERLDSACKDIAADMGN